MRARLYIGSLLLFSLVGTSFDSGSHRTENDNDMVGFLNQYLAIKYKPHDINEVLYVSIRRQKLFHIRNDSLLAAYSISSSKNGIGTTANSKKTPTGLHRISEKIGADVPLGGVFENRVYKGQTLHDLVLTGNEKDLITTRIIRLEGLEPGHNSGSGHDSYDRCIYIHGTFQEELIGTPSSHGCIRMRNTDVVELFGSVDEGSYVVILNN